jgi:hypothetical protein
MKNWQITGILTILIIGFLLISGCIQDNYQNCQDKYPGTKYNPSTKECDSIPIVSQTTSISSSTSTNADSAAHNKMVQMFTWTAAKRIGIGELLTNGEYTTAGDQAVLMREYIDNNLPEMRQLANGATTNKVASQEFVLYLEDLRNASNYVILTLDAFDSKNYESASSYANSGKLYFKNADEHVKQFIDLL